MSGTLHDQLADHCLLKEPLKKVIETTGATTNNHYMHDIPVTMFMVWIKRDESWLMSCMNQTDPTCFYNLDRAVVGELIDGKYGLFDRFKAFIESDDLIKDIFEVSGNKNWSFDRFHFYMGVIIKNTNWWTKNEEAILIAAHKNKKLLKTVRIVTES
jgi:hypothetical protein